jgi:hypothetical protein
MAKGIISIALLAVTFFVGFRIGRGDAPDVRIQTDTLMVRDTITIEKPVVEERILLQEVFLPVTDTIMMRDTIYVALQREQVIWKDSLSVVYASGVMPEVDSVKHFISERIVTEKEVVEVRTRTRWGVGIQAGYGIGLSGDVRMTPYVGIGVTYNLLSW